MVTNRLKLHIALSAIVICLSSAQVASAGAPNSCSAIFAASKHKIGQTLAVSLYYAPPMVTRDGVIGMTGQVLVETYGLGYKPRLQKLTPYQDVYRHIPRAFGKSQFHEAGLKAIYASYGDLVDSKTVNLVMKVESLLPLERQTSIIIREVGTKNSPIFGSVFGFMRIFDGSIFKPTTASAGREFSNGTLPLERILSLTSKKTSIVESKRREGARVFEIGKYFLSDQMLPRDHQAVRRDILTWLNQFITDRGPADLSTSYYFAHVASRVHQLAYQRFFGFEVVPKDLSENLAPNENILIIRGDRLKAILDKITVPQIN